LFKLAEHASSITRSVIGSFDHSQSNAIKIALALRRDATITHIIIQLQDLQLFESLYGLAVDTAATMGVLQRAHATVFRRAVDLLETADTN
jgi:hypothetical protein